MSESPPLNTFYVQNTCLDTCTSLNRFNNVPLLLMEWYMRFKM